jgi:benzoyl-CoA reductase/2-hydroxyglutaryl-CoA dehydratase subunit BcrC/BadD/HgdB
MSKLEQLTDEALRDPLAAARAHAHRGGRVIGFVGAEIPVEVIVAAGAFPLRLPSFAQGGAGAADGAADRYLESSFMPEVRSICEQYLQGAFDFVHSIVFPRSNDSAQRLYYYLSELRRQGISKGPEPLIFDLAKVPRATSRAHSRSSVERLASQVGARTEALPQAIAQRNRRRELFAAAAAARVHGASCRGSLMDRIFRAADFCDAEVFDAELAAWMAKTGEPTERTHTRSGPRLLLAGTAPPDERLHLAVEAAGGNVVAELGDHASRSVAAPMIPVDGSIAAIADHYQASVSGPRAFVNRAEMIGSLAKRSEVAGVINWLLEEEDALTWDLPAESAALAAAGIAFLPLNRRRWEASDGALEEIAQFTRTLEKSP